jgi:hypothetical protein
LYFYLNDFYIFYTFRDFLNELLGDSNPMVVANAVAAMTEINEASSIGKPLMRDEHPGQPVPTTTPQMTGRHSPSVRESLLGWPMTMLL